MTDEAEAAAEEEFLARGSSESDRTATPLELLKPKKTRTSRIRPNTLSNSRAKNPVKQVAGILGANIKAKKRDYNSTEITDKGK